MAQQQNSTKNCKKLDKNPAATMHDSLTRPLLTFEELRSNWKAMELFCPLAHGPRGSRQVLLEEQKWVIGA